MYRKQSESTLKQKVKMVFLGDKGVGKSSIISKFVLNKFQENTQATIGVDFLTKLIKYNCSQYKLELWDTAGQQKYRSLVKGYLRGANACVFVYDTSNPKTFANLVEWIKIYQEISKDEKAFILLFGNKTDLSTDKIQLQKIKKQVIKDNPNIGQILIIEGSAKQGFNIQQIFQQVLKNYQEFSLSSKKINSSKIIGQNLIKNWKKSLTPEHLKCCDI